MSGRRSIRRAVRHAAVVGGWLLVAVYLVVATGAPIPLPTVGGKDLSQAFPCMFGRCGCMTAAQCWKSCCCHTRAEQLAWAEANDVTPPAFVTAEAEADEVEVGKSCCAAETPVLAKSCCSVRVTPSAVKRSKKSCCEPKRERRGALAREMSGEQERDGSVVLLEALKCQGMADSWTGLGISITPVRVCWSFSWERVEPLVKGPALIFSGLEFPPPVPPPQRVLMAS